MSTQITTFEGFIRRILKVVFWVLLLLALIIVPIYYALDAVFHFPLDYFAIATTNPTEMLSITMSMLSAEPFRTMFALTVFPGFTFVALFGTIFMGWVERKLTAKIQLRTGPMYAGRYEGILQNIADFFKLLFKEIVIPNGVDKAAFVAVPFGLMAVAGALVSLVPLSPTVYIADPSVGAILVFAILGFTPVIVLLAGWASNSKYPFLGGLRALHQLVAYEIPLVLSLLGAVLLSGSLNLMNIVSAQGAGSGGPGIWFLFLQPLGAIVFFVGALAELERIPFDLPEADSEIVAGWQTEYTGMLFGAFQLANFTRMYVLAGLFTTFFLGGWLGPSILPGVVWFILKTFVVMVAMMLPRSILPRIRIDMMLRTGWAKLLALSFANIFITMLLLGLGVH
ncbi:MAG TPA: NADH-quinone oxidoreductase subunit NuoH [Nitrososphaerales archaeon]|nr:NADH-quinone oxidoreductase subunit NuoH [Nitrososphaerales archaeon]